MGDPQLVEKLRAGDEAAFSDLVERMHPQIVRIARRFVQSDAAAEDIAQDTWQAVLTGLDSFEGRSALSTWIIQIAVNRAKTRGVRDNRMVSVNDEEDYKRPGSWDRVPETMLANRELARVVEKAMDTLPEQQRLVVMLRDVEGLDAKETIAVLQISEENQRVLLHRARNKLRLALEDALTQQRVTSDRAPLPTPR